ncbi:MAG: superoxide dismutase [Acidimicrobiia bacterium]
MAFTREPLPYPLSALEPVISEAALGVHFERHHGAYVANLNRLTADTPYATMPLETVIIESASGPIFNNAAQAWNHAFFWNSMHPAGGGQPTGALHDAIETAFGSFDAFRQAILETATGVFGSGWTWCIRHADGSIALETTSNADLPLAHGRHALFVIDCWEHAYYMDYRNERASYVNAWLDQLLNWEFAAANYVAPVPALRA